MKRRGQTTEEMVMRAHYLNALDIESKAEKSLSDMERQDYIDTINDLRSTIESLRMTMKTLQATIETLNRNAKRHEDEDARKDELIEALQRQLEYFESINNRHNKNRYGSKTLSRNNRTDNKKKGRDEEKEDYTGDSDNKKEKDKDAEDKGGPTAVSATSKDNSIAFFFYDNDENDSRGLRPIQKFLEEFKKGTIQSDAYSVYKLLTNGNDGIRHLLCWAHVRNKFEEAFLCTKDAIADLFVKTIAELYRIENECLIARMSPEKVKDRRNRKDVDNILKSIYKKAFEYLNHKRKHFSEMTRKAMEYMKNGWEDLIRYRDDGRYTIDNLIAERAIRPFTGLRKNVQFFGCEDGVKETCLYLTLCETCKNLGVNFKEYITYAVNEIIHGNTDYESLTPWEIKVK